MRAANLLPVELRSGGPRLPKTALGAVGAGVLVGGLLAVGFVSASGAVDSRERELQAVQAQLRAVERPDVTPEPALVDRTAEQGERMKVLGETLSKRVPWDRVLRQLALVLPADVWLQSLSANSPTGASAAATPETGTAPAAGGAASQGLTLTGRTYSQESVARLLTRVSLIPELRDVALQSSTGTESNDQRLYEFTIQATVKAPGGTS